MLVKYKEYSCFDHSDFPAHSVFTLDVCCGSLGTIALGTQVQPKIILDPGNLPDYLFVSDDYEITMITRQNDPIFFHLLFELYLLLYFIFTFRDLQNSVLWSPLLALCSGL